MKKLLSYICIVLGLAIMAAGTSRTLMGVIWQAKFTDNNKSWWGEHHNPNGDLANIAYLDDIKVFHSPKDYQFNSATQETKNVDLYVWGDSYIEDVPAAALAHVNTYTYRRSRDEQMTFRLNKLHRNILLIETAERYIRPYFDKPDMYTRVLPETTAATSFCLPPGNTNRTMAAFGIPTEALFNPNINQNLEFILFNYNFMNAPHCWKADLNYYLFNRASGYAVLADNGQHLFLKETVQPSGGYSSYEPVADSAIERYVRTLNEVRRHYLDQGFDEVYLSIIPNPVSLLQPAHYNYVLPRISNHPGLQVPLIDVYNDFKAAPSPAIYFRAGDTHWNNKGLQLWLNRLNNVLISESRRQATSS
jgi:hypothetical protein